MSNEITQEEIIQYDKILRELLDEDPASVLLEVPGIKEILRAHFHEAVVSRLNGAAPPARWVTCCGCGARICRRQGGFGHNRTGYWCLKCWEAGHRLGHFF